jgi:Type IV secretion system pilin
MKYLGCIILGLTTALYADLDNILSGSQGLPGASIKAGGGETYVVRFISFVVSILQDMTAIAAVLGVCIVGIMFIKSRGDEEKTSTAKKYLVVIILGLLLVFTAWAIVSLIDLIPNTLRF